MMMMVICLEMEHRKNFVMLMFLMDGLLIMLIVMIVIITILIIIAIMFGVAVKDFFLGTTDDIVIRSLVSQLI